MGKRHFLSWLALGASFFAFSVIALGAFTRLMDAGLGCPDWPGCYGHLMAPAVAHKAWIEMVHRYFAGCLTVLILALVLCIFFKKTYRCRSNIVFAVCLILLVVYQIVLGQWTVTLKLLPMIVTQHLLGGFLILSVLWLIYLNNKTYVVLTLPKKSYLVPLAMVGVAILLLQITLGAWTSTHYAALSCPDFPLCINDHAVPVIGVKQAFTLFSPIGINYEGGILPEAARQAIQMAHRLGALILAVYMILFFAIAIPTVKQSLPLMRSLYLIAALLLVQIGIGISNVIFKLPLLSAMSHTLVAALLLLAFITFIYSILLGRMT